jgi:HEAT repeat protein
MKAVFTKAKDHERAFAASSLIYSEETSVFFKTMSSDKHATVRKAAANGMGTVKKPEFEQMLIRLTQDRDTEVRKAAAASLKQYPSDWSVAALIKLFNDVELLNEKEAAKSLMHISSSMNIIPAVSKAINGTVGYRRWSAHILGNLKAKQFADQIEVQLRKEKDQHARAEQVYALGQFVHPLAENLVNSLSKDPSPLVRAQLVLYIAKVNNQKFFPLIHNAAMKDSVGEVRWAALEGCGINGSPWFNKTLIAIMMDLDVNNMRDAQDRACACWAAGKIKGLSKEMYSRMRTVMKEPTVPQIMGPKTFDESTVLISILFSFIDQYKMGDNDERKYKKWAEHFVFRFNGDRRSVDFPRNYHNNYYSLQGDKYLKSEPVESQPFPRRRVSWTLKSLKEAK